MDDKKGFIMYMDWAELVMKLTDEDAGKLFRAIFAYHATREEPQLPPVADMLFSVMRIRFDQDIEKWESTKRSRIAAGSAGGQARAESLRKQNVANEANATFATEDEANQAVNVNVNVNGNVSVSESTKDRGMGEGDLPQHAPKTRRTFQKPSRSDVVTYCKERRNYVDPVRFYDYYEANGWMVGKNHMKDWRAAVRTWERGEQPRAAARLPSDPAGVHFALERKNAGTDKVFDDIFEEAGG